MKEVFNLYVLTKSVLTALDFVGIKCLLTELCHSGLRFGNAAQVHESIVLPMEVGNDLALYLLSYFRSQLLHYLAEVDGVVLVGINDDLKIFLMHFNVVRAKT